jgi:hypothetical protein
MIVQLTEEDDLKFQVDGLVKSGTIETLIEFMTNEFYSGLISISELKLN